MKNHTLLAAIFGLASLAACVETGGGGGTGGKYAIDWVVRMQNTDGSLLCILGVPVLRLQ